MNQEYLDVCHVDSLPMIYHRTIANHVRGKAYVLFGAHRAVFEMVNDDDLNVLERYNSAYLYDPNGVQDPMRYDKIHLIPFGEFMPLKKRFPWLYNMISILSPYDYDYHLTQGSEYDRFEIETSGTTYDFGVLICYEDTDGEIARQMSWQQEKGKADFLVNISNDGWYVLYREGQVIPSAELSQRTAICAFRAVENRISIVRSVNAGISCLIEPTGRIRDGFVEGDLPYRAMQRQGVEGWFVDRVVIDDRVTAFSQTGSAWGWLLRGLILGLAAMALSEKMSLRKTRMEAREPDDESRESRA
jgi:apolipoprotein N-acyltransferase